MGAPLINGTGNEAEHTRHEMKIPLNETTDYEITDYKINASDETFYRDYIDNCDSENIDLKNTICMRNVHTVGGKARDG